VGVSHSARRRLFYSTSTLTAFRILYPEGVSHTSPGCKLWELQTGKTPSHSTANPQSCGCLTFRSTSPIPFYLNAYRASNLIP
jgi:hypothetical protein